MQYRKSEIINPKLNQKIKTMLEDSEFEKEVDDLVAMLHSFRLIQDKGRKQYLKREIRTILNLLLRD